MSVFDTSAIGKSDVKTDTERLQELTEAVLAYLSAGQQDVNDLCHENRRALAQAVGVDIPYPDFPLEHSEECKFAANCGAYRRSIFHKIVGGEQQFNLRVEIGIALDALCMYVGDNLPEGWAIQYRVSHGELDIRLMKPDTTKMRELKLDLPEDYGGVETTGCMIAVARERDGLECPLDFEELSWRNKQNLGEAW